jgi:hypothetical protein
VSVACRREQEKVEADVKAEQRCVMVMTQHVLARSGQNDVFDFLSA